MTETQEILKEIRSFGFNNIKIAYLVGELRGKEVHRKHVTLWDQGIKPMQANIDALKTILSDLKTGRLKRL